MPRKIPTDLLKQLCLEYLRKNPDIPTTHWTLIKGAPCACNTVVNRLGGINPLLAELGLPPRSKTRSRFALLPLDEQRERCIAHMRRHRLTNSNQWSLREGCPCSLTSVKILFGTWLEFKTLAEKEYKNE